MAEVAKLIVAGQELEFPVIEGTENEKAIDISTLRGKTGYITLDSGFMNTGSCKSSVTFLDGEKGILHYRGYQIDQLAEKSNFSEVSYLLINGKLPSAVELKTFNDKIGQCSKLPQGIKNILDQFPRNAHPMGVIASVTSALSAFYPEFIEQDLTADQKDKVIAQLMAQVKIISAYFYRRAMGLLPVESDPKLSYSADFINMMFSGPGFQASQDVINALEVLLILHADHEQNCSSTTVRTVGSSKANLFASVSSGIDALWGQLHGGANQAVLEMLEEIAKDGGDYKKFIAKSKDKNDTFRLMGFGHRVYKNFDPRAKIIKVACDNVLSKLGVNDPLLEIAKGLEEVALKDPYFIERKLYPNVDFYSGIIYRALGIPTNMFTVMFALGRMPGWLAQWKEMSEDKETKIARPRQIYVGPATRPYVDISKR
jgi:citrate synthase